MHDNQSTRSIARTTTNGFKTVNGMEACTTLHSFIAAAVQAEIKFQNRKRYGGMHDHRKRSKIV